MKHSNFVAALVQFLILASLLKFTFAHRKQYIVALGAHSHHNDREHAHLHREKTKKHHHRVLGTFFRSTSRAQRKIHYSYENHLNAFCTRLTEKEAIRLAKHPEVISVIESTKTSLETTHVSEFLGFEKNGELVPNSLWEKAKYGEDIFIAGVDTGIWPESKSYSDEGMGPIPPKWEGLGCDLDPADGPTCNRKLIGARLFDKGYIAQCIEHVRAKVTVNASLECIPGKSARDELNHGTHTLATAGGNFVPGVNTLGLANGTAKGTAPRARVVGYKVDNKPYDYRQPNGTVTGAIWDTEGDKLAAFDDAIAHGAHVITMSMANKKIEFCDDPTAIGAFHAVMRGVVFVASGGNGGPRLRSAMNVAPWIFSVGASTINRELYASVVLGNNQTFKGIGLYQKEKNLPAGMQFPLITGAEAKLDNASVENATNCTTGAIDQNKLKGKILICIGGKGYKRDLEASAAVQAGEGVGMITIASSPENKILLKYKSFGTYVPSIEISYSDGEAVLAYKNSTSNPTAYLSPLQTEIVERGDPLVIDFSSRGPSRVEPSVLKPDIVAPGVDILAPSCGTGGLLNNTLLVPYIMLSGTSMSAPVLAGVAALLKAIHPDWSPAAIKSAIMTTATTTTQYMNKTEPLFNASMARMTPFDYGAGHVNPNRADDPGLVYDLTFEDYLNFLCARGYDEKKLRLFSVKPYPCPPTPRLLDFNYPAITIPDLVGPITVTRRLKNVGLGGTYNVKVIAPPGIEVTVEPSTLVFEKIGEEHVYKAEFKPVGAKTLTYVFGELIWSDGVHFVKIPLSVKL